jgi:hypothetical protein
MIVLGKYSKEIGKYILSKKLKSLLKNILGSKEFE